MQTIYKICNNFEWLSACKNGIYHGSADDLRDGFIHFSTAEQLQRTAEKHFAGQADLILVAVDADRLGGALKWEPSRGGALFPHLYGDLDPETVLWTLPLQNDPERIPIIPMDRMAAETR